MNNRQTKQKDRVNKTNAKQSKKRGGAVPSHLNRWQYGCIKKEAGASAMPFTHSPVYGLRKGWLNRNGLLVDFLLFLLFFYFFFLLLFWEKSKCLHIKANSSTNEYP